MKVSNFIKFQLKKWAPLFIVISIYCFVFGILTNSNFFSHSGNFILTSTVFPTLLIPAYVIPFFVFKEQFNKNMADTVNAFPANKYQINRIKILIGVVFIAALSTFLHLCCILINPSEYRISYFLAFLFSVLSLCVLYLLNCTLVSLGNTFVSSFLYVLSGCIILFGFIPTLFLIFGWETDITGIISTFGGVISAEYVLIQIEIGQRIISNTGYIVLFIFIYLVQIGIGALSFFIKQPSGEYYAVPGARNKYHKSIIYAAIGLVHVLVGSFLGRFHISYISADITITIYIVLFIWSYIVIVIFDKKFKITKYDWIILGSIEFAGFLFRIILSLAA